MTIEELLNRAKTRANLESDYALAKVLGIERQIISQWKTGKRHPSNEEAVKLATLAGLDEMRVIAEIELITANSEKKKEFWKHYIESRSFSGALAMTSLAMAIMLSSEPAKASILQLQDYDGIKTTFAQEYTLCAQSSAAKHENNHAHS
jgi:predicted transcriptional regulator